MIFRDRIRAEPGGETYRANVKVASPGSAYGVATLDPELELVTITLPSRKNENYVLIEEVIWRGVTYLVNTRPVPIMALGRIDHYELTAIRTG